MDMAYIGLSNLNCPVGMFRFEYCVAALRQQPTPSISELLPHPPLAILFLRLWWDVTKVVFCFSESELLAPSAASRFLECVVPCPNSLCRPRYGHSLCLTTP